MHLLTLILLALIQTPSDSQPLQRMAATERAFAASAKEIGVRDAFLTYFLDDAVSVVPGADGAHASVAPAKIGLRQGPQPKLPLLTWLMWEPFTGQVSGDGTFGWLTGGFANLNTLTKDVTRKGAYFSVWKRTSDGTWRVWLDEGITLPDVWQDASPFRVAPEPDAGTAGSPDETVDAAERSVAAGGAAWTARLSRDVRLHRDGKMPFVGREAAVEGARSMWQSVRYTVVKTEIAGSQDLAVTIGGYDAMPAAHGTWVRVWKRDVTGRWRIVFETSKAA